VHLFVSRFCFAPFPFRIRPGYDPLYYLFPAVPRPQVLQIRVHTVQRALSRGDNTATTSLYHAHYRGLQVEYRACNATGSKKSTSKKSKFHEWEWKQYQIEKERAVRETSVAAIAARARECAAANYKHQVGVCFLMRLLQVSVLNKREREWNRGSARRQITSTRYGPPVHTFCGLLEESVVQTLYEVSVQYSTVQVRGGRL